MLPSVINLFPNISSALESELEKFVEEKKHVYSVTAVIGSTGESAVDNIKKIHELREKMKLKVKYNNH